MRRTPIPESPVPWFKIAILSLILYLSGSSVLSCMATVLTTTQQFGFIAAAQQSGSRELVELILLYATLGTLLGSFIWGVISDAFGRKRTMLICLVGSLVCMVARAFAPSIMWLPTISFVSGLINGSLVVVKAYAGDILDNTNSAAGFTNMGICSIVIHGIALLVDTALYSAMSHFQQKSSYIMLWPSLLEIGCILGVLALVQYFFSETIRIKSYSRTSEHSATYSMALSSTDNSRQNSASVFSNNQLGYRRLSSTSEDEDDDDGASFMSSKYTAKRNNQTPMGIIRYPNNRVSPSPTNRNTNSESSSSNSSNIAKDTASGIAFRDSGGNERDDRGVELISFEGNGTDPRSDVPQRTNSPGAGASGSAGGAALSPVLTETAIGSAEGGGGRLNEVQSSPSDDWLMGCDDSVLAVPGPPPNRINSPNGSPHLGNSGIGGPVGVLKVDPTGRRMTLPRPLRRNLSPPPPSMQLDGAGAAMGAGFGIGERSMSPVTAQNSNANASVGAQYRVSTPTPQESSDSNGGGGGGSGSGSGKFGGLAKLTPPPSPLRRNVSFNGLVTVKVIGSDNLALGHLKTLACDDVPLNEQGGVGGGGEGDGGSSGSGSGSGSAGSTLGTTFSSLLSIPAGFSPRTSGLGTSPLPSFGGASIGSSSNNNDSTGSDSNSSSNSSSGSAPPGDVTDAVPEAVAAPGSSSAPSSSSSSSSSSSFSIFDGGDRDRAVLSGGSGGGSVPGGLSASPKGAGAGAGASALEDITEEQQGQDEDETEESVFMQQREGSGGSSGLPPLAPGSNRVQSTPSPTIPTPPPTVGTAGGPSGPTNPPPRPRPTSYSAAVASVDAEEDSFDFLLGALEDRDDDRDSDNNRENTEYNSKLSPASAGAGPDTAIEIAATPSSSSSEGSDVDRSPRPKYGNSRKHISVNTSPEQQAHSGNGNGEGDGEGDGLLSPTPSSSGSKVPIAVVAQQLLSSMHSKRYHNGADFYEGHLGSISMFTVLYKTLRSLVLRSTVVLSTSLYAINMCIITAISLCTPIWLMRQDDPQLTSAPSSNSAADVGGGGVQSPSASSFSVAHLRLFASSLLSSFSFPTTEDGLGGPPTPSTSSSSVSAAAASASGEGHQMSHHGRHHWHPNATDPTDVFGNPTASSAYDPVHNPSGLGLSGHEVVFIVGVSFLLAIALLMKFFTPAITQWKVVYCYRFGCGMTVAAVLLVPSIYAVHEGFKASSQFYTWVYVVALYTLISLGSMWSLLCTILMINNSGYKWERGTVFGLAETFGCVGKLSGILLARYFYPYTLRSSWLWPFDSSCYWYFVGMVLYASSNIAMALPKAILKKKREPKEARYALSIGGGVADEWFHTPDNSQSVGSNGSNGSGSGASDADSNSFPRTASSGSDDIPSEVLPHTGQVAGSRGGENSELSYNSDNTRQVMSLLQASRMPIGDGGNNASKR